MYSMVTTSVLHGMEAILVQVEADVSPGLPTFEMVGFLSSEVKEAKEEEETLIKNEDAFNPQTAIEGLGISLGVMSMDDLKEKDDTASVLETVIEGESDIAPLVPVTKKRGRKSVEK